MSRLRAIKGWVPLIGVPALFLTAYVMGMYPSLAEIPMCGVKLFLGLPCPGCGLTHACVALVHGHLWESLAWHPLGAIILLWMLYQFIRAAIELIGRKPLPHLLSDGTRFFVLQVFIAALMLQWIVKLIVRYA